MTPQKRYVAAVLLAYVTGKENAFELYQDHIDIAENESDVDYVIRAAEQDYDGGEDSVAYPEFLANDVVMAPTNSVDTSKTSFYVSFSQIRQIVVEVEADNLEEAIEAARRNEWDDSRQNGDAQHDYFEEAAPATVKDLFGDVDTDEPEYDYPDDETLKAQVIFSKPSAGPGF